MEESYTRRPGAPGMSYGDRAAAPPDNRPGEALAEARQQAGSLASEAKEQGKAALSRGKDSTAAQLETVADSLHATADDLKERNQEQAGRFIDYAAERLDAFSRRMRDKDLDALIEDAARIGRNSPVTLFAGSVAAGFLLSRFVKSSAKPKTRAATATNRHEPVAAPSLRPANRPMTPFNAPDSGPARASGAAPSALTGHPFSGGRPE